ncbi:endogenous retrovirus group K member 8 Gag polyprotein-like [Perognathus longimembris pacificus]|uniref:endogenous retrovirus group K member 8 Gag polyprotein-like n=1 Tax=Perognathus longimembris pacificus TaxID=214514 RepID=UPI002019ACA9|nr:endogenous retrovirus group K member 8 Gag polyprotein-like [Perognathus longimembris pacificus]
MVKSSGQRISDPTIKRIWEKLTQAIPWLVKANPLSWETWDQLGRELDGKEEEIGEDLPLVIFPIITSLKDWLSTGEIPLGQAGAAEENPGEEGGDPPADPQEEGLTPLPDGPAEELQADLDRGLNLRDPGPDAALPRHAAREGGSRQPLPSPPPTPSKQVALSTRWPATLSSRAPPALPYPQLEQPLPDFAPGIETVDFDVASITAGWEPEEVKEFRDLRKTVTEKGPNSPWAHALLRGLSNRFSNAQTWRRVGQTVLDRKDYKRWCAAFRNACSDQAEKFLANVPPIPVTFEMMYGPPNPHVTDFPQVSLPAAYRRRVWALGMWAWTSLGKGPSKITTLEVIQGATEDLVSFIERVEESIQLKAPWSQIDELVRSLVWDGMAPDHKIACAGMKDKPLESWIYACRSLDTQTRRTQVLTASLNEEHASAMANGAGKGRCYGCGGRGHLKRECPSGSAKPSASSGRNSGQTKLPPKTPCPRCKKGYHWQSECKSKFEAGGKPLN